MRRIAIALLMSGWLLAGCAGRPPVPVAVADQPPVATLAPALPQGASPGMLVPEPLADGSFPTPNRALSADGAVWHLRAALNVAALSCRGEEGDAIRAGYNGWLRRQKAPLARAMTRYAAEYGATPAGRAGFDAAMTRLYNFFAQTPARAGFCAAAAAAVAALPEGAGLADAPALLATLDRPFTDFYRAYDAWRAGAASSPGPVIAAAAVPATAPRGPRLVLDLADLPPDTTVAGR